MSTPRALLDPWVCRIPRATLLALAAEPVLGRRQRVLFALLAALYENYNRDAGAAAVSIRHLASKTRLPTRTVQAVLDDLRARGVLVVVEASPGKTRKLRLQPHTDSAYTAPNTESAYTPNSDSAYTSGRKRVHPAPKTRTGAHTESVHTTDEKESSEELSEEGPDAEQAPRRSGPNDVPELLQPHLQRWAAAAGLAR